MDQFTVQSRSDSETFKNTDPSSSDERGKKKSNLLRKPKRTRRKKKNSSLKKSKSPNMGEGWSVAIRVPKSEDTEEPASSDKSEALINTTSDDDDCFNEGNQMEVVKSVSKSKKKIKTELKQTTYLENADSPMPEVIKSVSKHIKKATRGSNLKSPLERVHIENSDEPMIVENNGRRLTVRTDILKRRIKGSTSTSTNKNIKDDVTPSNGKNRSYTKTAESSNSSSDTQSSSKKKQNEISGSFVEINRQSTIMDVTSSNGKNRSYTKTSESSNSSSDTQNSSKKKQNETAGAFAGLSRQSRIQKSSPIADVTETSSSEDDCDTENYAIVTSNVKSRQSKIGKKSLSQYKLTPKENIENDNERIGANKSLRRQTRYLTKSTVKQNDMDNDLTNKASSNLDDHQNPQKSRSFTKYISNSFADSDSDSDNQDSNSAVDSEINEASDKECDTFDKESESDNSDTSNNCVMTENKDSSVLVQNNKHTIHSNQDKSPVHKKTRNSSKEIDKKSNNIKHSINDDDDDSSSSDESTIKQKRNTSVVLLNPELSIISLSDDSTKDITLKNTPIIKMKPGATSTEIKKSIQKQSSGSNQEIIKDEKTVLNETFTSENPIEAALKEFKFEKNEMWTDPKSHTFCGADIPPAEDEKRDTYNLERSVIDLGTLKNLEDNEQRGPKRASIGQRIAKRNKQVTSDKLSTTLKAKGKLKDKKSIISKQVVKGVLNESKKNVTFNGVISTKIKPTKMPNFSKIHQQQLDRSESLVDYVQRKQERSQLLLSARKSRGAKPSTPVASNKVSVTPQAGCSYWNDSVVKSGKKQLIRSNAFENDTDVNDPPQKKRVTYSSPFENNAKSPKVFAKTPGKQKYFAESSSIDTPNTDNKVPCKSPRINKSQGKTFMNLTPQKTTANANVVIKSEKTPKRISPKLVKTPKRASPKASKTPKRVSPKAAKTPKRVSPKATKTPKRVSPKSEKKMVLVKSPKSPITKLVPLKLFPSTSSSSDTKTNTSKRVLVNVVASKNSKNVQNKQVPKKTTQIPRQVKKETEKENNINVNNVGFQPSTSSVVGNVVKENMKHKKKVDVVNEEVKTDSNSPKKKPKTRLDKEALKMAANKSRVVQTENVDQKREVLKGMRTNRRFDLLMKFRNKK